MELDSREQLLTTAGAVILETFYGLCRSGQKLEDFKALLFLFISQVLELKKQNLNSRDV